MSNINWPGYGPLQQQPSLSTHPIGVASTGIAAGQPIAISSSNPGVIWTTGTSTGTIPATQSGGLIGISNGSGMYTGGSTITSTFGNHYTPLILNSANGKELLRIDNSGDIITLVHEFDTLRRVRFTDHVQIGETAISLWDELYKAPGVENTGRSLLLPEGLGRLIGLYVSQPTYADLSLGEFIRKAWGTKKTKRTKAARTARKYKK